MADSREEKIIKSMLGEQVELEPPQSRIEVLLYELKDAIEQGGGGSGGGSAEPFFFVIDIKGIDQQSGNPIVEETSTTYDNLISMIADGRPIYCHLIVPLELASLSPTNEVDSMLHLIAANHAYHSETQEHNYFARFDGMMFMATSPSDTLVSGINISGGGPGNPT